MSEITPPTVPAYALPDGIYWIFWCKFCLKWHRHGAASGHRVAHCHHEQSPYFGLGYVLTGGELAPAWIMEDYKRCQPHGPPEGDPANGTDGELMRGIADPPTVTAYALPGEKQWVMWCEPCKQWHKHDASPGHRLARCWTYFDRYSRGYVLTGGQPAPPWMVKDVKRRRPLGPVDHGRR